MKKKLSKKFILGAAALLAFSTGATISGTYAWFVASNVVTVTGPTIKAEAEDGIVVANETHTAANNWAQSIDVSHDGQITNPAHASNPSAPEKIQASFIPTSTADAVTWYHANANNTDDYRKNGGYSSFTSSAITATESETGVYRVDLDTNALDEVHNYKNIYLLNSVWLQASAAADLLHQDLFINAVTASTASQNLSKSLRVLFKTTYNATTNTLIYAPLATGDSVVHDNGTTDGHGGKIGGGDATLTVYKAANSGANDKLINDMTISAYTVGGTNAQQIDVYVYFEGEDFNCKSSNIVASLEDISIEFKFENKVHQ